ncbi:MAG: lipopolysaccharide biosynthesis protein [Bacillota bacterium]
MEHSVFRKAYVRVISIIQSYKSSLVKNAFYLIIDKTSISVLGFIFWNIMARFFVAAEVGIGTTLFSVSSFIALMANIGLGSGIIRFMPDDSISASRLINSSFTLTTIVAFIMCVIYLAGVTQWTPTLGFLQDNLLFMAVFFVVTIITALSVLTDSVFIAGRATKFVLQKNVLISVFKIPTPIILFYSFKGFGIFIGIGVAVIIGTLVTCICFIPKVYRGFFMQPRIEKKYIKRIITYSLSNFIANLTNTAPQFIYPIMVLNVLGPEKSAYFYIAWMMTVVLAIIPNGIAQSFFAEGSHDPLKLKRDGRKVIALSILASVPAVGMMILLGGWLLHFFGPGYRESGTEVLYYLALATIPQSINSLYIAVNQVRKKVHIIIAQTGVLAAIALGLGYWLLCRLGLPGAGIAYALAHLIVALVVVWPLWGALKEKSPAAVATP